MYLVTALALFLFFAQETKVPDAETLMKRVAEASEAVQPRIVQG
jgi:hypothetical protein